MRDLIEGYYNLRQEAEGLRREHRFEALPWEKDGEQAVRQVDGWKLSVYRIEGQIEACVSSPDGTSKTYS